MGGGCPITASGQRPNGQLAGTRNAGTELLTSKVPLNPGTCSNTSYRNAGVYLRVRLVNVMFWVRTAGFGIIPQAQLPSVPMTSHLWSPGSVFGTAGGAERTGEPQVRVVTQRGTCV